MSRLTRDGTAEPISRDQFLRRERGYGNVLFVPVQLTTSRIGNLTRLTQTLLHISDDHAYIHTYTVHKVITGHTCILNSSSRMGSVTILKADIPGRVSVLSSCFLFLFSPKARRGAHRQSRKTKGSTCSVQFWHGNEQFVCVSFLL